MAKNGTLVRTDLETGEWGDFRKLAIDLSLPTKRAAGDAMRIYLRLTPRQRDALLKGAKP